MIAKEKVIFWILLPVLVAGVSVGINVQEKKKASTDEFLRGIESVTSKAKVKKTAVKDNWDIEGLKAQDKSEDYSALLERNIFFRPVDELKAKTQGDIIPLKKEEPPKPVFVYKGRMMVGSNIIVIIQDRNTGKSFSVKEGDTTDDFTVLSIEDNEVRLKGKNGEEISVSTVKEEKKEENMGKEPDSGTEGLK